jgi:cobalt/nickel transport system permease protein
MHFSPAPLHIPDGFLSLTVSILSWIITIVMVGVAVKQSQKALNEKQIPLMGIMAAFIFAAQMINFPVAGGTSGHMLGGALAAIVLGPWAGILVMTSVVALQGLLFQDGGLVVMGANILNMGIIPALIGFGLFRIASGRGKNILTSLVAAAAWISVLSAALLTSTQIWLSGITPAGVVFPAMLGVHALIGIGEALITVAAFSFITQVRPDLLSANTENQPTGKGWIVVGGLISLAVVLLAPLASASPDGLERVAEDLGFLEIAQDSPFAIFSDYLIPAFGDSALSTILAGTVGIVAVAGAVYLIGQAVRKPSANVPGE